MAKLIFLSSDLLDRIYEEGETVQTVSTPHLGALHNMSEEYLTKKQHMVLDCLYFDYPHLSYRQTAKYMGVTVAAVYKLRNRAIEGLSRVVQDKGLHLEDVVDQSW
jgi:DNA-directed RNA polymerase specialized sigma subunit